jgi:Na+/melibiose symporter-like transporter
VRVFQVFFAPGDLFESLREKPLWGGTLFVGGVLVALSVALMPVDIWVEMLRENAANQGGELPPFLESAGPVFSLFSALAALIFFVLMAFVTSGIVTFFFAFLLGDEGRFVQYLSVVSHGLLVSALGGLILLPLRILQKDPEITLNLGTFVFFISEGYLFRVLKLMDLFGLWGSVIMAIGVSTVDPKRGLTSSMIFFFGLTAAFALVFGIFGG